MQDPAKNPAQDKDAQKRRIQFEIAIADSDLKKKQAETEAEKMNLKRLMGELAVLQTKIAEKKQVVTELENEKIRIENDTKALKKKMNSII